MNEQRLSVELARKMVKRGNKAELLYVLEYLDYDKQLNTNLREVAEVLTEACERLLAFGSKKLTWMDLLKVRYCPHAPRRLLIKAEQFTTKIGAASPQGVR